MKRQERKYRLSSLYPAAFRRLCVETCEDMVSIQGASQPPSGGCVLKQHRPSRFVGRVQPAAFRRLCVETRHGRPRSPVWYPAAFRRLCVETNVWSMGLCTRYPAAFRRLCVETNHSFHDTSARVPAAFRRLCVETSFFSFKMVY